MSGKDVADLNLEKKEKEKEREREKNRKEILWKLRRQQLKVTLVYFWIAAGQRQSFEVESLAGGKKPWKLPRLQLTVETTRG